MIYLQRYDILARNHIKILTMIKRIEKAKNS